MATRRDVAGSQQELRPGFAADLAPEAIDLHRFMPPGGSVMTAKPLRSATKRLITR